MGNKYAIYKFFVRCKALALLLFKIVAKRKVIIDVTGIILTPGNNGEYCLGNGKHINFWGETIECCCDECDYYRCCTEEHNISECNVCNDNNCPHNTKYQCNDL